VDINDPRCGTASIKWIVRFPWERDADDIEHACPVKGEADREYA